MNKEKLERRLPLYLLLLVIVLCYYGQYQIHSKIDKSMEYCYKFSTDKIICDELCNILDPEHD